MTEIAVIRPGCTDFDSQNRISGRLDLPLNADGEAQTDSLIETLRSLDVSFLLCGPGEPSEPTAARVGAALDLPIKVRDDLRNLDQGLWQGLTVADVHRRYPKLLRQWQEAPESVCPPEGEQVSGALARVRKVLKKPLKKGVPFAVVAADPLATLVESIVLAEAPEFRGPMGSQRQCGSVTVVSTEGALREERNIVSEPGGGEPERAAPDGEARAAVLLSENDLLSEDARHG